MTPLVAPTWLERQPVKTYYELEKQEPYRQNFYVQKEFCGICNRNFKKNKNFEGQQLIRHEVRSNLLLICGNHREFIPLHLFICDYCHEKYKFKENVENKETH